MENERVNATEANGAVIGRGAMVMEGAKAKGRYHVQCVGPDGQVKWTDTIENLVTTAGKNDALDKYLAGSAYTAAFYLGLISLTSYTTGPAAGDTSASHGGWAEDQNYSQAARPTAAWSAASAGSKALSSALAFS